MAIQSPPRIGFGPRFGLELAGLVGALAAGVGIGAFIFDGSGNDSPSSAVSPPPVPAIQPAAASAAGVGELSDEAFLAAAYAIHEAYMEAHFGKYVDDRPGERSVLEKANAEGLPPFPYGSGLPAGEASGFDVGAARSEHDILLPQGGN